MTAHLITRSISLPEPVMQEIDLVAAKWYATRSHTITRIFQEWKQLRMQQPVLPLEAGEISVERLCQPADGQLPKLPITEDAAG